jgi:tRNA (guanine-N7-)-methyltransferase
MMRTRHFTDRLPEEMANPELNPYVASHRTFGPEVLPASEASGYRGRWHARFGRTAPIHLEVGSGSGFYLSGMAAQHPEADWIGIELRYKRVVTAARKLRSMGLTNAVCARYDAMLIDELFEPGSLAGVHVNHPDPWAKDRHAKHRLIGRPFLEVVHRALAAGGELRLKTDFPPHIDALLEAAEGLFDVTAVVPDVKAAGAPWPDEVRTNFQRKADEKGVAVGAVWARRR